MLKHIYYPIKTILTILSGYKELHAPHFDIEGNKWFSLADDYTAEPYYVCAAFNNGRHIPLPIILCKSSRYPLQNFVLHLLSWHPSYKKAFQDCQEYNEEFSYIWNE